MSQKDYLIEELVSAYNANVEIAGLMEASKCHPESEPYRYTASVISFILGRVLGKDRIILNTTQKTCAAGNYTIDRMEVLPDEREH